MKIDDEEFGLRREGRGDRVSESFEIRDEILLGYIPDESVELVIPNECIDNAQGKVDLRRLALMLLEGNDLIEFQYRPNEIEYNMVNAESGRLGKGGS